METIQTANLKHNLRGDLGPSAQFWRIYLQRNVRTKNCVRNPYLAFWIDISALFIADSWWVGGTPPSAGTAEIGVLLVATVQSDSSIKVELEAATSVDDLHGVICQAINSMWNFSSRHSTNNFECNSFFWKYFNHEISYRNEINMRISYWLIFHKWWNFFKIFLKLSVFFLAVVASVAPGMDIRLIC